VGGAVALLLSSILFLFEVPLDEASSDTGRRSDACAKSRVSGDRADNSTPAGAD
jgi:hypothetical protein